MRAPKLDLFCANPQEDIDSWLGRFLRIASTEGYEKETYIKHCVVYFDGYAGRWFENLENESGVPST